MRPIRRLSVTSSILITRQTKNLRTEPRLDVDCRRDVYLLGAMLIEIVTGKALHVLDQPPKKRQEHVKACPAAVAENARLRFTRMSFHESRDSVVETVK
jgi:hypothetical protein